jgi:hypothetical protein
MPEKFCRPQESFAVGRNNDLGPIIPLFRRRQRSKEIPPNSHMIILIDVEHPNSKLRRGSFIYSYIGIIKTSLE